MQSKCFMCYIVGVPSTSASHNKTTRQKENQLIRWIICLVTLLVVSDSNSFAQTDDTSKLLTKRALDYVAGYYSSDIDRMDRAIHPDLAKRAIGKHPKTGRNIIRHISKSTLLEIANGIRETTRSKATQDKLDNIEVTILAVDGNIASVKVVSADFIDYLHLGKWNGDWQIINIFWRKVK